MRVLNKKCGALQFTITVDFLCFSMPLLLSWLAMFFVLLIGGRGAVATSGFLLALRRHYDLYIDFILSWFMFSLLVDILIKDSRAPPSAFWLKAIVTSSGIASLW